ncbi:MAG: HAMP domain-containing protein [Magnetococcales bacterium]|nr:HAMP domain-containing protein [Magnetococcales bacterium]
MRFFAKLFLTFWLSLIVIGGLIAWAADHMRDAFERRVPDAILGELEVRNALIALLTQEGVERLRAELSTRSDKDQYHIFDEKNNDILGRHVAPPNTKTQEIMENRHPFRPLTVTGKDGLEYRVWMRPKRPSLLIIMGFFPWLLVGMVISSGAVVFILALHFTKPIKRLRETSLKLAAGDLTARYLPIPHRIPDELSNLGRDFNFMAERLSHLFHSHKRLIRDISHELRSPLARMRVAVEMVNPKDQASADNLQHIELEMERLNTLIGQIITLSRYETVQIDQRTDWIEVNGLIEALVVDVRYEGEKMERSVELNLCGEVVIRADGDQLRSALENVIRNALRHTPRNGHVFVSSFKDDRNLVITVRDEGEGVPEDQLQAIFLPFYRVGEDRNREHGGFGLGLAIASHVIEHHDGTITATNHSLGGLIVTIVLPIQNVSL